MLDAFMNKIMKSFLIKIKSNGNIVTNIFWLLVDKFSILIINLLVTLKVANHYGPSTYGTYEYALSIIAIITILNVLIDSRVVKKYYLTEKMASVYNVLRVFRTIFSVISFMIGIVILMMMNKGQEFNFIYITLLINNVVISFSFPLESYFEYNLQSKKIVISTNISRLIISIVQLYIIYLNFSIRFISTTILAGSVINFLIISYLFKKNYGKINKLSFDKDLSIKIARDSLPLALAAVAYIVYTKSDQIMIGYMLNTSEVGIYSISNKLISVGLLLMIPIQSSIFPKMHSMYLHSRESYNKLYIRISSLMTCISILIVVFSYTLLPTIFKILFNETYYKSIHVFQIQVFGLVFMYNALLRSSHFTIICKTKIMLFSQVFAAFLNVGINYLLVPTYGAIGASFSTVVTQCIALLFSNYFFEDGKEVFRYQIKAFNPINIFK